MTEERRLVTVMFADVVGSTGLGEQLDAEDVRAMLAAYFAIAREVVAAHDGTIEKFVGDAVMGVFGLPHAHGDDPDRALSAALELRDRVRADPNLTYLKLRFGVCTGEVVATSDPGADFLVTGEAVNIAARLQQAAEPGAVLVAERTLAAVSAPFDLGPAQNVDIRGKSSAIKAREVRAKLSRAAAAQVRTSPMRGRQDELDQLTLVARRAFRERKPAFITVIAPPGTGKTRLLEEFLNRELELQPESQVAVAQCLPYGNQLTYWPLRQALFRLVGLPEDAAATDIRQTLSQWLDNPRRADLIATSIGYGLTEAADRSDVFAAWRAAFEKASSQGPLVLVFEDLHWSSESLLDLVDFVMQIPGEASILMIALTRPELLDRRPGWGGGRRNFSNLFLEPLSDPDIRDLVDDLMGKAAMETVEAIVAQAGGNPFYAAELVRSVGEGGAARALPDTVQASIQARLDLLPGPERRVLQLGSIFGRTFRITGLIALAPELEKELASVVEGLLRRNMLRSDDPDHFSFAHILIRDVAYQAMTRAQRARLHAAAGAWLESRAGGREGAVAELVGFHYREALSLVGRQPIPDFDADAVKRSAVLWLSRAGDAAGAAGANLEASRHFRAAIELASADRLPELYERLGDVEQLRRGSIDAYSTALDLARKANWPADSELRVLGSLLMCVVRWAEGVGRFPLASVTQMREQARALALKATDARSLARFYAVDAFYPWHVRREGGEASMEAIAEAEASGRRGAKLAQSIGDWSTWSAALDGVTTCLLERHEWTEAREISQLRVDRHNDLSIQERMDAHHMVTQTSVFAGDLSRAYLSTQESKELLTLAQNPTWILTLLGDRMHVLLLLGRWDEVVEASDAVLSVWTELREALSPTRMGFIAGLEVARARRDLVRASQFVEAIRAAAPYIATGPLLSAYADLDPVVMEREVLAGLRFGWGRQDASERLLSALNDRGWPVTESTAKAVNDFADAWRTPFLKAQALRTSHDFAGAATLWAKMGARPYEARARIELSESKGEKPDADAVTVIRQLGDIEYLEAHRLAV